jgi:hypothetical protein
MEQANSLVPIVMFGSIPLFLLLFGLLPARRAVLASFLGAWLFLPVMSYQIQGFPNFSKLFITSFGVLIAVIIFDFKQLVRFRPAWVDIPMVIWCLVPIASSLTNNLGLYDGLSEAFGQTILWGVPYFLGRIYFRTWTDLRELAVALIIAGLIYTPLVLYEMRMSPSLHLNLYGYHQHRFDQTQRFGMWRPMVFMQHGLMLAFFTMSIALSSFWLWWSGTFKTIPARFTRLSRDLPFWVIPAWFTLLTIFSVSVNAWLWMLIGLLILLAAQQLKTHWVLGLMMLAIPVYVMTQSVQVWPQDTAVEFAVGLFGPERAQSLSYRYFNEEMLTEKAREQWVFGWAGWGRQLVRQEWGPTSVPDSLWIIVFGKFGTVGIVALLVTLLLPAWLYMQRYGAWIWGHPNIAPAIVFAVILVLYMFDGLLNAMINPIYMVISGAILSTWRHAPGRDGTQQEGDN